ncbi:MAG: SusD/RagB family nutrient-binding outer membrane lipoprotein [Bacteroidia bacterium]|nr:SusD/RagB family nutrient-binding outer membrane lipoprotein [Bacteroidia bacterium]
MKKIIYILVLAFGTYACTGQFEEINTNPNEAIEVSGDLLLPTVIFNLADMSVYGTYGFGDIVAQYMAHYEYNDIDIYRWTSDGRFWGIYDYLQDISDIKDFGVENDLPNYEAVALILEAYSFSILTDAYGDVPYSEANQAEEGIISPAYDTQQSIYEGILANLKKANEIIDVSGTISGDILYGGDMMKWKKFANSLRVRLLMRTLKVRNISADLQQILDNPSANPIFEGHADEAIYFYAGSTPDLSPYSTGRGREYEYFLAMPTHHLVDLLLQNNDPRIHEWLGYKVNDDGTLEYLGVAPGQVLGDIGRPGDFATKDTSYFSDPAKITAIFMTYSELNFILAEAAETGIITGDAKGYYEAAVQASFTQWNVEMPADFLTTTVPYETGNTDRIYEQKWLALYHTGVEAWFDWKRTGKPAFIQPGPGNLNGNKIPVRLMYPSLEQSVNGTNYNAASQRIGGDNINSRVWWDK